MGSDGVALVTLRLSILWSPLIWRLQIYHRAFTIRLQIYFKATFKIIVLFAACPYNIEAAENKSHKASACT